MANNRDDLDRENETAEDNADRGMPSISKNRKSGGGGIGQKIVVGFIAILVILALIAVNGGFKGEDKDAPPKLSSNSGVANRLGPPPTLPPPPAPPAQEKPNENRMLNTGQIAPPPPSSATANRNNGQHEQTPEERKRTKSLLAFGNMSKPPQQVGGQQQPVKMTGQNSDSNGSLAEADRADSLANNLKGTEVSGSRASLLVDRSYFITQGAFLSCALETAISSDVPGMTACRLTDDVYSTDKKVLLLEKGSKIVGQYQGGMKKGQARIFVLWTRIETPKGVIVKLDSPGTDSLGRSGLDGFIDTHFWERFGSAIMLSTIDDAGTYLANKASGNGSNGNQFNFGGTADTARDTAGIALENDINIPPTLVKNQGDAISIFVARDLDFRGYMTLKPHTNGGASLLEHLRVLQPFLEGDGVTEVVINKPGEVITEGRDGWKFHDVPSLNFAACSDIAKLTATFSKQSFDDRHPIVSATLPHGERIQIVRPPATLQDRLSLTIRKPADVIRTLDDYERDGAFSQIITDSVGLRDFELELLELKKARKFKEFLTLAIKQRQNLIISGSTGSGKTTFMRSLLQLVPDDERLITIENVDELKLYQTHRNVVPLFYSAGGQGIADITQQHLLESSLRMKPDRIFCAELIRGDEAFYYLRNVNSGHPGSITSMHGTNPRMAIEQLVLFIKESKSGGSMSRDDIKQLLFSCIDVIVQFQNHQGRRYISEIYYEPEYKQRLLVA